jgi:hypothetical protein
MARTQTPNPTQVMVARTSGCVLLPDGREISVVSGSRLRSDHPLVQQVPEMFLEDGDERLNSNGHEARPV